MTVPAPSPARRLSLFWIALAAILLLGGIPRLLSVPQGLPYIENPDEPSLYLLGQQYRGLYAFDEPTYHQGYPPGYVWLHIGVQVVLEALGQPGAAATVAVLRVLSALFSTLTGLAAALIARRIAGDLAGLLAGAFWMFSPILFDLAAEALTDPLAALLAALVLGLAVIAATDPARRHWCVWSAILGAAGMLVKYPVGPVMIAGGVVALGVFLWEDRRRGLRYLLVMAGLLALLLVGMALTSGGSYAGKFINREDRPGGFQALLEPARALNNIIHAALPFSPIPAWLFGLIVLAGVGAYIVARRNKRPRVALAGLAPTLAVFVALPWVVTIFSTVSLSSRLRDVIPATPAAAVLLAAALVQIVLALPRRWARPGQVALVVALTGLVFVPQLLTIAGALDDYRQPDTRAALRAWAETTLEPAPVIVTRENHKLFNDAWSGLPGARWFEWQIAESEAELAPETWRADGFTYAVLTDGDVAAIRARREGQAALEGFLPLRDFREPPGHRGPKMTVYRLWRMAQETDARFRDVSGATLTLAGYDAGETALSPGEALTLRLYWGAAATPAGDYSLFVHLAPPDSRDPVVQWDGPPALAARPTLSWNAPNETLVGDWIVLELPVDLPPGEYRVLLGLYDYTTGVRLPVTVAAGDGLAALPEGDTLHLLTLSVE